MICNPCKAQKHEECPSKLAAMSDTKTMGLNTDSVKIQLSGLCPCQHKITLMKAISVEEASAKIRAGLNQECGCGGRLVTGPEEPEGEQANFVALWFEDHSYEDLSKHGLLVAAKTQEMRAVAE